MRAMGYLDFPVPEGLFNGKCYGARTHFRARSAEATLDDLIAVLVTRSKLDDFLLKEAIAVGAQVAYQSVRSLDLLNDKAVASTDNGQYAAKIAIIAAGATSKLIGCVRRPDRPHEIGFCLEQDYPVMSPDPFEDIRDRVIDIYFGVAGFGYGWIFHHGDYYSVGVGGPLSLLNNPRQAMKQFWLDRGFPLSDLNPKGAMIPCGGLPRRLVSSRAILVGDSAGFVDPFYGEGIAYAIRSGQLAAKTAELAFETGDFSERQLSSYADLCQAEFDKDLSISLRLTRFLHKYPSVFMNTLCNNPKVLRKYLTVPLGECSSGSFAAWMLTRLPALGIAKFLHLVK